jgi:hypothetical protein
LIALTRTLVRLTTTLWLGTVVLDAQASPGGSWRDASAYLRLFAPPGSRAGAYRIYVSRLPLQTVLADVGTEGSALHPPGAWAPIAVLAADAFSQTGRYDRSKLARLYGARRPVVARGPHGAGSRVSEAWTLISPYPSLDMSRLEEGTMLIVLDIPAGGA